ncbi:MAG: hypothetical protein NVS9B13_12590 [Candidatus Acidiferrum sp.]
MHRALLLTFAFLFVVSAGSANPPARPKILGISFVRFKSADFEKSSAFYSQTLGLPSGQNACKGLSNPCFSVNSWQHVELTRAAAHQGGGFLEEVGFATDDLAGMRAFLIAHQVQCTQIAAAPNGLLSFELADPEGHRLAFTESSGKGSFDNSPAQISNHLIHAGFVVKDRAAENRFYLDLLGFRLYWHGGFKEQDDDWYEIQVPDGDNWIEYMLNISSSADRKDLGVQNHFSLGVENVHLTAGKLRANGATAFDGPEIGRDGKDNLNIYDPDLTRVEVMEFAPAKTPCCHSYSAPHPKP